ncbi:hypothetical protein [Deinococcus pimensis]|uniref:hypothetical protein n=1 Tax=Deinococcus pimensis TaxID=309888 RepID=UPI000480CB1E|nr:hypothetical protein [Deinococcus pimensis]
MKTPALLTLPLALLLGACAPSVTGGSAQTPSSLDVDDPVNIRPGESLYVAHTYPAPYFGIDNARMGEFVPVNFDDSDSLGRVRNVSKDIVWFENVTTDAPAGWTVSLNRTVAEREMIKTETVGSTTKVNFYNRLKLVYKVAVPADAPVGPQAIKVVVTDRAGVKKTLPLLLNVVK